MGFLFEDLLVYKKSMELAKLVLQLTTEAPRGNSALIDQLRRAVMSIPANLAEGSGRWHTNDRKQFFWIARGSVNECLVFIDLGTTQHIFSPETQTTLRFKLEEIARMITALISSISPRD